MEDKYEEFKKWLAEQRIYVTSIETEMTHCHTEPFISPLLINYFENFEKELEEIERRRKVKKIFKNYFPKIEVGGYDLTDDNIDKCYEELKKEELLK